MVKCKKKAKALEEEEAEEKSRSDGGNKPDVVSNTLETPKGRERREKTERESHYGTMLLQT